MFISRVHGNKQKAAIAFDRGLNSSKHHSLSYATALVSSTSPEYAHVHAYHTHTHARSLHLTRTCSHTHAHRANGLSYGDMTIIHTHSRAHSVRIDALRHCSHNHSAHVHMLFLTLTWLTQLCSTLTHAFDHQHSLSYLLHGTHSTQSSLVTDMY